MPLFGRVALVTLAVSAVGAVVGAVLGALTILGVAIVAASSRVLQGGGLAGAASFGSVVGAVLAPVAAWTLMRHVAVWRVILETALGTALGAALGLSAAWLAGTIPGPGFLWPFASGLGGFVAAALRLRFTGGAAERARSDSGASRAASRTAAIAMAALVLTLASSVVPGTRIEVQDWDCPPAPASCARPVVAVGFPFPYISDYHGLSPGGRADLLGALFREDRFRPRPFVANLAVYAAAVGLITLGWTRTRRRTPVPVTEGQRYGLPSTKTGSL
jgi:hypothetical protein